MIKLTKEQILLLHTQLIQTTGGSDGIRDVGLLESALESPFQSYGGDREISPAVSWSMASIPMLISSKYLVNQCRKI